MPLPFRVKGVSISTATNWVFNYIVGEATPVLQDVIRWRLYPMHAFFCVCSFILVYFTYPETCGVPLEEMSSLFADVGLEGDDNQSLVNSERSSIMRALEPPDISNWRPGGSGGNASGNGEGNWLTAAFKGRRKGPDYHAVDP